MSTKDRYASMTADLSPTLPTSAKGSTAQLAIVHPPDLARRIALTHRATIFGRDPEAIHGKIEQKTVSRRHFEIRWDGKASCHLVADLDSHNGSWLDGQRLTSDFSLLHDQAVLRFGSVIAVYEVLPSKLKDAPSLWDAIPGGSPRMVRLRRKIAAVAPDPSPVLVQGSTGVGKEHVVQALHELSGRSGRFVAVNVSELSPQLAESQLFGHVKGAFTGAQSAAPGLFRHADRGTLFMDELGELSSELQPKLLRVIEQQEVRPVGAARAERMDVRLVVATNRALTDEVERGAFRRDLWARISLFELYVPKLAERRADILDWVRLLHERFCEQRRRTNEPSLRFSSRAVEALLLAEWPENLRGLDRLVHRLAIDSSQGMSSTGPTEHRVGKDQLEHLLHAPSPSQDHPEDSPPTRRPAPTTAEELAEVLARFDGNVVATARWYGRHRRQIYRWIKALGVERQGRGGPVSSQ